MSQDSGFEDLMARLRAGDEEAAALVYHRYVPQLIAVARSRLDRRIRPKVDPEDIMQSVFRSFFVRHADGQFDLHNWDSLLGMLTLITVRKCGHRAKHFRTARRDVQREVHAGTADDPAGSPVEPSSAEPTPPEKAIMAEIVEELLHGLDDSEQPVLLLSLQGYTVAEISAQVGRTERTVQRVLQRLRKRLERMQADA
jgi:RNA polymerase sigma-70 factor (ECF subfamily)